MEDLDRQSLYKEHRNAHLINFVHGSIPVLAAATISRTVTQFLVACVGSGDISDQIVAYFLYSICVAHVIGYLVALYLKKWRLFEFYFGLATDNASFAWNSTLTLAIINWLYAEKSLGIAIAAWLCLLFCVFLVVYLSNYVQDKVVRPSKETKYIMRNFESEAFALAIAYSFTVIIAACIYRNESTNYLSNTDDVNPTNDDGEKHSLDWLFFAYVVVITLIMVAVQKRFDRKQDKRLNLYRSSIEKATTKNLLISEGDVTRSTNLSSGSGDSSDSTPAAPSVWQRIVDYMFAWDDDKSTISSLRCLLKTSIGYLVGCGWHLWSVLSFQGYFKGAHGSIYATFIFAFTMTVVVILLLTKISVKEEIKVREAVGGININAATSTTTAAAEGSGVMTDLEDEAHGITGRGDLWFIFGRLSVGWAWQTFISEATAAIVAHNDIQRKWLLVLVDVINAIVVCTISGYVLLYFEKAKPGISSNNGNGGSGSGGDKSKGRGSDGLETPLL